MTPAPPKPVGPGADHHDDDEFEDDFDDDAAVAVFSAPPSIGRMPTATSTKKPGFFARLFGRAPPPPEPVYLVVDPVAEVLAIPRGPARLDAFERRLTETTPGTDEHRRLALAFHHELTTLATHAGVDLTLFEARVTACAQALIAAGEDEKAGSLYARIGRRHQAAELFVKAGAVEALEEAHAELAFTENRQRFDARLAFERFESLFLVGRRDEALASLEMAVQLWDTPIYAEVLAGFRARLPAKGGVVLKAGDDVVRVVSRFPLIIGRGEDSAVRIDSPLVSRAHVDIQRRAGELVLTDLVSSGGTRIDGVVVNGAHALGAVGVIDLGGVEIEWRSDEHHLQLVPRLRARHRTIALRGERLDDVALGFAVVLVGERLRLVADGRARVDNEAPRVDLLLLIGDRIAVGGRTWIVSG